MTRSCANFGPSYFRAIYIEESARDYSLTTDILERFPACPVIYCDTYKEIYNRPGQNMPAQKLWPALILAVKQPPLVYRGARPCQDFGCSSFYYANLATGCPFDCEYCYLQGLYPSADIVVFVNIADILEAVANAAAEAKIGPAYVALSHDSDLVALYSVLPQLIKTAYSFLASRPDILAEIRTKSSAYRLYHEIEPLDNLIIGFTLSPQGIIDRFENRTSSLKSRLVSINRAIGQGFRVRLCFDPVFINSEFNNEYEKFYDQVFSSVDPDKILDVSLGFFRMPGDFFRRLKKRRPEAGLFSENFVEQDNMVSYAAQLRAAEEIKHLAGIGKYISDERIFTL